MNRDKLQGMIDAALPASDMSIEEKALLGALRAYFAHEFLFMPITQVHRDVLKAFGYEASGPQAIETLLASATAVWNHGLNGYGQEAKDAEVRGDWNFDGRRDYYCWTLISQIDPNQFPLKTKFRPGGYEPFAVEYEQIVERRKKAMNGEAEAPKEEPKEPEEHFSEDVPF